MPGRVDPEFFQDFVIQVGQHLPIDSPLRERIGILAEAELF
jgi:hypothetical protein